MVGITLLCPQLRIVVETAKKISPYIINFLLLYVIVMYHAKSEVKNAARISKRCEPASFIKGKNLHIKIE